METGRLRAISLFADLSDAELTTVAAAAREIDLPAGETLTAEGAFGHALFAVEEGTAEVLTEGVVVGTVRPGDVVGEIAVVASGRRTATVVATSPMRLIALFKRDVWALERSVPEIAARLQELRAKHLNSA